MAASTYDEALRRLLLHEGGYTNHPSDPGGPTNFGITIYDCRKYLKPSATAADVKVMKLDDAKAIYRRRYWDAQRCDELPAGVDYSVLDYGVNSGIGRSGKVLRRIVGLPDRTHVVNDEVLEAVARRDAKTLINAINIERLAFLKGLKTWPVFGHGWARRVDEVNSASLRMTSRNARSPAVFGSGLPASHIAPAPGKGAVPAPAGMRKLIVGPGAAAPVAAGGFTGWIVTHPIESAALGCGIALAVGGSLVALKRWHQRQQDAATAATPLVPELTTI